MISAPAFAISSRQRRANGRSRGLLLGSLLVVLAGAPEAPAATLEAGPRFEYFSVEEGLSHIRVYSLDQDAQGFIWIGTQNGLNRFDGYRFKIYRHDPDDPHSLSESAVVVVHGDRRGDLWVGTRGKGLDRWLRSQDRFEHFRQEDGDEQSLSNDAVNAILEDHTGALWIGTRDGLNHFRRESATFRRFQHDPADPGSLQGRFVSALYEDRSGKLWVATEAGLNRFDARSETFAHYRHDPADPQSLIRGEISAIEEDRDGHLWIATKGGLDRFDRRSETFLHFRHDPADPHSLLHDEVRSLKATSNGDLWITTAGGLARLGRSSGRFVNYRRDDFDPQGLRSNSLGRMLEDRDGMLWIGGLGLHRYNPLQEQFTTYRRQPGSEQTLSSDEIQAIHQDRAGILWIGTRREGLDKIDRARGTVRHYAPDAGDPASLPHARVNTILEDREGTLWLGTAGGLARLDRDHRRFTTYRHDPANPESLANNLVRKLYEDRSGRLWVGTFNGGPSSFDRENDRFIHYSYPPALERSLFLSMIEDHRGTLWFGTSGQGLFQFDPSSRRTTRHLHDSARSDSLSNDTILSMYEDVAGFLWLGTASGLNRLNPERTVFFHYLRERSGLHDNTVLGVQPDEAGYLWLSTSSGLSRFDPRTESFRNFGAGDGLRIRSFFPGSYVRSARGEMFFGGKGGFTAFHPDSITAESRAPDIVISDFRLFSQPVPIAERDRPSPLERSILETRELVLSHRANVFSFEFAGLHYANPARNRYRYRLEGFDRDWIRADANARIAQYSNLEPGEYVFRVRGSNAQGVWNERGASIKVVVTAAPWKTWWAYSLYATGLVALVASYLRQQQRKLGRERAVSAQLRDLDRLKDDFLANTSHDLRTPLHGMIGIAESLIDGATGELPEKTRENLGMIMASGLRLGSLIDDILDFTRLKHGEIELSKGSVDLRNLVDVVLKLSHPLLGSKPLELENTIAPDLPPAAADEARLEQIFFNLIGNAIKFTDSGSLEVGAAVDGDQLVVRVSDTGIGIAADRCDRIFEAFEQADASIARSYGGSGLGLAITHHLVSLHGGKIWVESTLGQGTSFFFTLAVAAPAADGVEPAERKPPRPAVVAADLPAPAAPPIAAPPVEPPPAALLFDGSPSPESKSRILIVDDEPINRQVLINHLAPSGFEVAVAASGPEALRFLEERRVDLILLDIMMPRMSGYEVCQEIRKEHGPEELPVIFLSAKNQLTDRVKGLARGANDYLMKPIAKPELLARVRTHLNLSVAHRTVRQQALVLEAQNTALLGFTHTFSHHLRNPLTTIHLFLGRLEFDSDHHIGGLMARDIERIRLAAKTMERLMGDLIEISQIGIDLDSAKEVALFELAQEAMAILEKQSRTRSMEIDISPELPVVVGNRRRLLELFGILLDNATKFAGERARVLVGARDNGAGRVLFVRDNGVGIEPRYHEKVFGLFEQLDQEYEGTGIGLALARRVVEVHGGRIWVESEGRGKGSTFCFTLPPR